MREPLPDFAKPPVTEVALGVQFAKLDTLKTPQLGYVWQVFRDRFPQTDEQPPLEPVIEQFGPRAGGPPSVRLELLAIPPRPRVWLLNEAGTELVQLQQDRFVRNWRKREDADEYPRYRQLRERFEEDFQTFCNLVETQQWGIVEPNQCEVTYVNIIPAGEVCAGHGDLGKVVTVFRPAYSDNGLGEPEEAAVRLQFVLKQESGEPVGRLHIAAEPVFRVTDNRAAIRLTLTARGKPEGSGTSGVMRFLDRGHEAIVRGFASVTTSEMHRVWERKR